MADVDSDAELVELLTCPICLEFMYPPIYQCPFGHLVCSSCKPKMKNRCPICREEIGNIRALALEKMAAMLHLNCMYKDAGCKQVLKYDQKQKHEEECRYRPYKCPFPCSDCVVTGDVETLVMHLGTDHGSDVKQDHEIDTIFVHRDPNNAEESKFNVTVYSCLSQHFCLNFEAFRSPTDQVYMTYVTFMGDDMGATSFCYNIEIGNDEHKMSWQGCTRSIREGAKVRESYDGLVIHRNVARSFAEIYTDEQLVLRVRGFIWAKSW